MALRNYGVVKGRPLAHRREIGGDSPHYQIHLDAGGTGFRLPVNVKSSLEPSQLVYFASAAFLHPLTEPLPALAPGFHALWKTCSTSPGSSRDARSITCSPRAFPMS